jgi:hypothetical protein
VAAFNQHVDDFAHEWGRLLQLNGMKDFHTSQALRHRIPLSKKVDALGVEKRTDALLPFIACIRKHLDMAIGCWVDVKVFKSLPPHFLKVFGNDPSYMAFVRTLMQVIDFTPERDGLVMVCDEDEETASEFYRLYRRVKKVWPGAKDKMSAISFCDDHFVFGVQAADFVASMVRLDALARRDKKKHDYRRLFRALIAQPERHERIWFCGIAKGDKKALLKTAQDTVAQLRREGKIK